MEALTRGKFSVPSISDAEEIYQEDDASSGSSDVDEIETPNKNAVHATVEVIDLDADVSEKHTSYATPTKTVLESSVVDDSMLAVVEPQDPGEKVAQTEGKSASEKADEKVASEQLQPIIVSDDGEVAAAESPEAQVGPLAVSALPSVEVTSFEENVATGGGRPMPEVLAKSLDISRTDDGVVIPLMVNRGSSPAKRGLDEMIASDKSSEVDVARPNKRRIFSRSRDHVVGAVFGAIGTFAFLASPAAEALINWLD